MELTIRECTPEDLPVLQELSCRTYDETFRHMNTPSNMKAYLEKAFDMDRLRGELSNSGSAFYFLYGGENPAGYLKLNEHEAQTDIRDPRSLEIERIYVAKGFHGRGLGSVLLNKAVQVAGTRKKSYLWLGVWEKNEKAIRFYKRNGFYVTGNHSFFMGEEEQTDFILRKDV